ELLGGLEALALLVREHAVGERDAALRRQHFVLGGRDRPVDPQLRRHARREVQVGRAPLHHVLEQLPQCQFRHLSGSPVRRYSLSAAVSLRTSSTEVTPRRSFMSASRRSVSIPPWTAARLISIADARCSTRSRSGGVIAMTS